MKKLIINDNKNKSGIPPAAQPCGGGG